MRLVIYFCDMESKLRGLLKKMFKIELIFIYLALFIFFCTVYFKRASNAKIQQLDSDMLLLQLEQKDNSSELISKKLKTDYEAYTYFDETLKAELTAIIQNLQTGRQDTDAIINFQNHIHETQTRLNFGFDSLLYSSLFLIAIAAFIILEKFFKNSMQLEQLKTMQTEQTNFSRDLHDGVAQNLAALKVYLEKEDIPKSKFYAKQALNEIRYMIGSGSIDFSDDLEKTVREICQAFEVNFSIKTAVYVASQKILELDKNTKSHLVRILQESLSNISRHSNATKVEIKIIDAMDEFRFIISDNGKGFEQSEVDEKNKKDAIKHYGVHNIKKRAELIGGTVDFINDGGLTIAITIKNTVR